MPVLEDDPNQRPFKILNPLLDAEATFISTSSRAPNQLFLIMHQTIGDITFDAMYLEMTPNQGREVIKVIQRAIDRAEKLTEGSVEDVWRTTA